MIPLGKHISRPKLWLKNFDKDVFAALIQNGMDLIDLQMSTDSYQSWYESVLSWTVL